MTAYKHELEEAICEALGINPNMVTGIDLHLTAFSLPTVSITMLVPDKERVLISVIREFIFDVWKKEMVDFEPDHYQGPTLDAGEAGTNFVELGT